MKSFNNLKTVLTCIFILLTGGNLIAENKNLTLGGGSGELDIYMNADGNYTIFRDGTKQIYSPAPIFAVKIGTTVYSSSSGFTIEDKVVSDNNGIQVRSKTFTRTHGGKTFSIIMKLTYNTASPETLTKEATLQMGNIAANTEIALAYGWDAYVNGSDRGSAISIPDMGYNGKSGDITFSQEDIQSMRLIGGMNLQGGGSLIAFCPVGRPFDRAYSAGFSDAYAASLLSNNTGNLFRFGSYESPTCDNGIGVVYENISAGETTVITTNLAFSASLDGELDYFWNGEKELTVGPGEEVNLGLAYTSYSPDDLNNVGFQVNFPGLEILAGGKNEGFTSGTISYAPGNEYVSLSNGAIVASGTANFTIPVNTSRLGEWTIDNQALSQLSKTMPLGLPATLKVTTGISLSQSEVAMYKNMEQTVNIQLADNHILGDDLTAYLSYKGDVTAFAELPNSVVIPAGENQVDLTIVALLDSIKSPSLTIALDSTSSKYAIPTGIDSLFCSVGGIEVEIEGTNICPNLMSTTLTASAGEEENFTFAWYSDLSDLTTPLAEEAELALEGIEEEDVYYLYIEGTDEEGNSIYDMKAVSFTVLDSLVSATITPEAPHTYLGGPVTITAGEDEGGSGTYTYQWQISYDKENWESIEGATDTTYFTESLLEPAYFRRIVQDDKCGNSVSNEVSIIIKGFEVNDDRAVIPISVEYEKIHVLENDFFEEFTADDITMEIVSKKNNLRSDGIVTRAQQSVETRLGSLTIDDEDDSFRFYPNRDAFGVDSVDYLVYRNNDVRYARVYIYVLPDQSSITSGTSTSLRIEDKVNNVTIYWTDEEGKEVETIDKAGNLKLTANVIWGDSEETTTLEMDYKVGVLKPDQDVHWNAEGDNANLFDPSNWLDDNEQALETPPASSTNLFLSSPEAVVNSSKDLEVNNLTISQGTTYNGLETKVNGDLVLEDAVLGIIPGYTTMNVGGEVSLAGKVTINLSEFVEGEFTLMTVSEQENLSPEILNNLATLCNSEALKRGQQVSFYIEEGELKMRLYVTNDVYHTVSLSVAEGINLDIQGNHHFVKSGDYFYFHFEIEEAVKDKTLSILVNGKEMAAREINGRYAFLLNNISTNTYIELMFENEEGDAPTHSVVIEDETHQVVAVSGGLRVKTAAEKPASVCIYTINGQLKLRKTVSGEESFSLPAGIYITRVNNQTFKSVVK